MCFDEFNRFDYSIFSILSESLYYLLQFRRFGHRIDLNFHSDLITMNPSFQFCVTYNPTYLGRQTIPKSVSELFRNVAMVNPDELVICNSLLLSSGYLTGEKLAKNIINIFKICRWIWKKEELYDFGLRALRSIINYATKLLMQGTYGEENSII